MSTTANFSGDVNASGAGCSFISIGAAGRVCVLARGGLATLEAALVGDALLAPNPVSVDCLLATFFSGAIAVLIVG